MKTFFDANVLLEVILPDRQRVEAAKQAIATAQAQIISPLTVHLYVHFGQKQDFPLQQLLANIELFELTDMSQPEVRWAIKHYQNNDFEDALQVACAVLHGCDKFVTLDKPLAQKYRQFIDMQVL